MERNTIRRVYERFFAETNKPDLSRPNRCVKISEIEELIKVGEEFLSERKSMELRSMLVELKRGVYKELKSRDQALYTKEKVESEVYPHKNYFVKIRNRRQELPFYDNTLVSKWIRFDDYNPF